MQHHRKANQRGNALVEFALVAVVAIPLMLGTVFLGVAMGNNIQAIQISRDVAHMYAKGVDFSNAGNTSIAAKLAQDYNITSDGNSVVILSQIIRVFQADCDAAGYSSGQCANLGENVVINRLVIGKAAIKASDFGTPTSSYMDAKGNLSAADYLTQPAARATLFSSLITQRQGAVAYVAEVFVPVPNFNFYATSGGTPGVFARAIF